MRRFRVVAALVAIVLGLAAFPSARHAILRAIGGLLVIDEANVMERADVGVMTESGEAGELEVSDRFHQNVFPHVLVLTPSPTEADRELDRRGVHIEDLTQTRLRRLGVPDSAVTTIEAGEGGTTETTQALAAWVREHPFRVLVIISPSHARRYRRTLLRVWPPNAPLPRVTYPRHNLFHAEDWWQSRRTLREGLFELEKLAWDYVTHPLPSSRQR